MTRMRFDHRRDQAVADDFEAGQSLNCAAQGCPNLWSVDQGQGRLCSWHHWAGPHQWPHITAELHEEARRRASRLERERAEAAPAGAPSVYSKEDRLAMLMHMSAGLAAFGRQPPKAWAWALKPRDESRERLTRAQRDAWREALKNELRTTTADEEEST